MRDCTPRPSGSTSASTTSPRRCRRASCRQRSHVPGLDFAAFFAPLGDGNEVGGDFYDVFPKGRGHTALVGDVCGKGPEAAKLTALCRYTLRAAAMLDDSGPRKTLALLNRAILRQAPEAQFCTVVIADLEPTEHDTLRATISTAGHPAPLVIRGSGETEALRCRAACLE